MSRGHWHFPRTELTNQVFLSLTSGPLHAYTLFGPRRTGKTQFLIRDLAQFAEGTYRHRVVYASLWQNKTSPLKVLLYECDQALRARSVTERMGGWISSLPLKATLRLPDGSGELEMDMKSTPRDDPDDDVLLLDSYIAKLADPRKPALLLLDEFQAIAIDNRAEDIIPALRTILDKYKDGLAIVFTGSSRIGLDTLFSGADAPFYRFATQIDLPDLDEDFVRHQQAAFKKTFNRDVENETADKVFERFDRNPLFFQRFLTKLGLFPDQPVEEALAQTEFEVAEELGFDDIWWDLSNTQRIMLRLFAEEVDEPFGSKGAERFSDLSGKKAPGPQKRQSAQRLFRRRQWIDQWQRGWRLTDPLFKSWVLDRPDEDFK